MGEGDRVLKGVVSQPVILHSSYDEFKTLLFIIIFSHILRAMSCKLHCDFYSFVYDLSPVVQN